MGKTLFPFEITASDCSRVERVVVYCFHSIERATTTYDMHS